MDASGVDFAWRNGGVDHQLQLIDGLDFERKGNAWEKVIHTMWKSWFGKTTLDPLRPDPHSAVFQAAGVQSAWACLRPCPAVSLLGWLGLRSTKETALPLFGINSFFTLFHTWLRGELVGEDAYGNRYYREKASEAGRRERRWVVYSKEAEPTRVPPGWVGWLHGRIDEAPSETPLPAPHFEKEPLPNLTGTTAAYLPPGAVQRGGARARATGDYEAWRPE